ncbi:hypothetical protein GQ54DRAFT_300026, partial [Martensiomyces pterosporus]
MPGQQANRLSCAKHLDTAQASEAARMATEKPFHIRDRYGQNMHSVERLNKNGQAAYHTQAEHEWRCDIREYPDTCETASDKLCS